MKTIGKSTVISVCLFCTVLPSAHASTPIANSSTPSIATFNTDLYEHAVILGDYLYYIDEDGVVWAQNIAGDIVELYQLPEDEEDPYNGEWKRFYSFESIYVDDGSVYVVQEMYYVEPYYKNRSYSLLVLDAASASVTEVNSNYHPYGEPELGYPDINNVLSVTSFAGKKYYVFEMDEYGQELWTIKGEGSNRLFTLLADFMPGEAHGSPASFHEFNGELYFIAASPKVGRELWKMDDSETISLVADINPEGDSFEDPEGGSLSPNFYGNHFDDLFYEYQGSLYFIANHIDYGRELWKTDGTQGTTQLVLDAHPGISGFSPMSYQPIEYSHYEDSRGFYYREVEYGRTLAGWVSNGTPQGTRRVGVGKIGDYVWLDSNGNGKQDPNESGMADVYVELSECDGNYVTSSFTDAAGFYLFDQVDPGSYQIYFSLPNGYSFSPRAIGNYQFDSNVFAESGWTRCLDISPGQVRNAIDAGMVPDDSKPSLSLERAIYFSEEGVLWIRGMSNTQPAGSAQLAVSAILGGKTIDLGQLPWRTYKGTYQSRYLNLLDAPELIKLTDENGLEVIGEVEIR